MQVWHQKASGMFETCIFFMHQAVTCWVSKLQTAAGSQHNSNLSVPPHLNIHLPQQVADVLQLVVEHCSVLGSVEVCTLLQLSRACRRALQKAVGHLEFDDTRESNRARRLASFAAWLPKHAGLVKRLTLHELPGAATGPQELVLAEQLLTSALQMCLVLPVAAAAPAPAGVLAAFDSPQPLPLQLQEVRSSPSNNSAAFLRVLAAYRSLTSVTFVCCKDKAPLDAICGTLGHLTSLQRLELQVQSTHAWRADTLVAGLQQLQNLTSLTVHGKVPLHVVPHLPGMLQFLHISLYHNNGNPAAVVDLSHLTCLKGLDLRVPDGVSAASTLPAALAALTILGPLGAVKGLRTLKVLELYNPEASLPFLQGLPTLTQLNKLKLALKSCDNVQLSSVLACVAAATHIQRLVLSHLGGAAVDRCGDWTEPFDLGHCQLHSHFNKLPALRSLKLCGLSVQPGDLPACTSLMALTALTIDSCPVGDMAFAALACKLPFVSGLKRLVLDHCGVQSPLLWPMLAGLTGLERLRVLDGPQLEDATLMLLS